MVWLRQAEHRQMSAICCSSAAKSAKSKLVRFLSLSARVLAQKTPKKDAKIDVLRTKFALFEILLM